MILLALFMYIEDKDGKHITDMVITVVISKIDLILTWIFYQAV